MAVRALDGLHAADECGSVVALFPSPNHHTCITLAEIERKRESHTKSHTKSHAGSHAESH